MSQADELLNSVASGISLLSADERTEPHIVIGDDRFIIVPDELKRIAVQFDHDVETVTFDCPRYWDGIDMSKLYIYINYMRSDMVLGCFKAENVTVDPDNDRLMHFTWTISQNVSLAKGNLSFLVCIRKADANGNEENHWNSELCKDMYVSEGLECGEAVLEPFPDILSQWEEDVNTVKAILLQARDNGEFNGATFTPSVSADGILTWTNDKGRDNPDPVDISLTVSAVKTTAGNTITISSMKGSETFEVLDGGTEVIQRYMSNYVVIGNTEPTSGPVLWLDTSVASS